ncbi:MAG: UDP-N-acetylmuramate--L-alanine ligase [Candidatus Kaiserbacteria bacterium]|nr:MAG: UDP-N-acetylmuramate--L-alanine ligase [Candidatus Kaiserbacteria bacterium]
MKIPDSIYMVGIGGIGMSALAQLLAHRGKKVSGSDREESPATDLLAQKGIEVWIGHDQCHIPADAKLLVYSDAVPETNVERMRAEEMGIPQKSYFEALGEVSKSARTIAVAGTHGKTTTTGMLAKILHFSDKKPSAVVGSIVQDFGSNFLPGAEDLLVVEACEYRDHLLKLSPQILVITNIELDHTDYFPNLGALQKTFRKAAERVPENGIIVTNPYDPHIAAVLGGAKAPILDYTTQTVPALKQIGEFNRMNARAAKAAARAAFPHLQEEYTDRALMEFKGSWRRFEYRGETPQGAVVYDDYAHHPTAIEATIEAARAQFPQKKITVVFHPHLFSRTRDLFDGFVRSLATADYVILAPIYAAREKDLGEVSSDMLAKAIAKTNQNVLSLHTFDAIRDELLKSASGRDLIITMGAGDIYKVAEQIAD